MQKEKCVLIVDDDPDAIEGVESILSEVDCISTISANGGESGLVKAKEVNPDLIILDVQMPGKSGFDVFTELKKQESTKAIPVIMLTGVEEQTGIGFSAEAMKEFLGNYPEEYIEKPVEPVTLQKIVTKLLKL
ncbi:MAG: response regulator [Candidatus Latescibacteria bacterium]|jgi:CheY-like chemotaxis protein|nr:response regulator [Candidatus Latescibacterota bacterium]